MQALRRTDGFWAWMKTLRGGERLSTCSACRTIPPAIMALVVAMAGIMLRAISVRNQEQVKK